MMDDDNSAEYVFSIPGHVTKVFISGPMTGYPNWNHGVFNDVAMQLRIFGFTVVNPAEFFDGDTTRRREEYMRESVIKLLNETEMVVLLPGWADSSGALVEASIAYELGYELGELKFRKDLDEVL
jgi:hypothetical protein